MTVSNRTAWCVGPPGRPLVVALVVALVLAGCGLTREPDRPPTRLTFLQFNDHYILEPVDRERTKGGMARIATLVARTRAESPHTLLALAGDTISPSIMSAVLRGEQMIAAWNLLGLDVAAFGNHEFDFGPAVLLDRMRESRFTWVATNVRDRATGRPFGGARATHVVEAGGARIGFLGLTVPDTAETSSPGPGVEFLDPVVAARQAVDELTRGPRRPLVVAVTHQNMPADETLAREVPGLALVIGGHEHDPLESVVGQTLITKAGSDGVFVVRIDLQVTADGRVLGRQHRFIPVTAELPEEPAMAALVARYEARLDAELGVAVGQSTVPLDARNGAVRTSETNTGNLVADAIRARLRADVAVMNGGGIRGNRVLPAGPLTRRDVRTLLPFLNVLVKLEVPGEVLLAVLERSVGTYPAENGGFLQVSGLTFTFDPRRPVGQRVVEARVGGEPLDPARRYTLATSSYTAQGGDGYAMLRSAKSLVFPEDGPGLAETLADAITAAGTIAPRVEGRIQKAP